MLSPKAFDHIFEACEDLFGPLATLALESLEELQSQAPLDSPGGGGLSKPYPKPPNPKP